MQRMNMFKLYSDLYNVLLQVFVLLAIGRLIFHLRRLIILWTGFKKNKEATALKVKVNGIKLSNKFLQQKMDSLVIKLKAENDHRFEALKAKDAFNQEVTALKHQVKDLTSSNEVLMIKVENLVAKLDASDHKIVALQVNAALKQEKISQTESQCEEFKMQNSLLQEQIESLSKKQATCIQEADEARKSHEEDMKRLSFENEIYKSQISHSEKKIQQLSNTTQKEVEIKNNVIKYLRAANEKLAAAEEENSQNKSQCVDLERKNRLLQEEIESVSSKMVTSDQAAAEAGKVYEEDMKRLSTENELFCSQIKDTAQHIQMLTKTIQEQESMKNLLSNYLRAAYEKLVAAEEKISQIESKCEEFKTPNSLLQKQIESLCKKLTTSMQEADEARKSHEEDMKRLSNENELFKSQIENTAQHIQDLKNTIQEQESMKNDLKKYLKKKKKQKGGNERQLDQLRESSS